VSITEVLEERSTMAESEKKAQGGIPIWQQGQSAQAESTTTSESAAPESTGVTLEQARRFLRDDIVQTETKERKREFLKSKGLAQDDIERLLEEEVLQVDTKVGHSRCRVFSGAF
jgi:hypothetical protein